MNLQESIKRIIKEETERVDGFLDEISSVHTMSDELRDFVKNFINDSNCERIDFANFKMAGAMGVAIKSGVLINKIALKRSLPFLLFLIFHEIAHQYQFKKYGNIMYKCYIGDISEMEAAEFMKHTEEVADDFASRKIRELQKLNLIDNFNPVQIHRNLPIQQVLMMVSRYREDMRMNNIDTPEKVSEYFYNIVKSEL
jgi:hypothetical protein